MTVAEEDGIGTRGAYYDQAGALRDMVQNHMFQLMTLVAMEPPISFRAEDVRDEKVKVLHAVAPLTDDDVRAHTSCGRSTTANAARPTSRPTSRTETFVAMRLFIDNWRWAGVPFYLRTGKRLPRRVHRDRRAVQARAVRALPRDAGGVPRIRTCWCLRIQPDEGISLSFHAKEPGPFETLGTVTMDFSYAEYFKAEPTTGYETLLFDAHDRRSDAVPPHGHGRGRLADRRSDSRLGERDRSPLPTYAGGSSGPPEADLLIESGGRDWRQ